MQAITREFREGVQLVKHVERDQYDSPSVVYEFTSERETDVSVHVVESARDSLEPDHVDTHRGAEPNEWDVTDARIAFDVDLEPRTDREVVCALRPQAPGEIEQLAGSPAEFTVEPARHTPVRGATTARSGQSAGADGTETTEDLRADGSTEADAAGIEASEPTGTDDRGRGESVAAQLVAELQSGRVSEAELDYLEQRFGTTHSTSVDARIARIQRDFADIRAYSDALEEFLDEHGSGRAVIDSFGERLDSVESDLESLESTVTEREGETEALRDDLRETRSAVASVSDAVTAMRADVDDLSTDVERLNERLPPSDIEGRVSEIEDDVSELLTFTARLRGVLDSDSSLDDQPE